MIFNKYHFNYVKNNNLVVLFSNWKIEKSEN